MKREYNDSKKESINASAASPTAAIFSNLHRHPHLLQPYSTPVHFHHHQQQQQQPFPFPVVSRDGDDESSSGGCGGGNVSGGGNTPGRRTPAPTHSQPGPKDSNDGASIEIQRRPRGRPPGSKNKPKPPVIITQEPDPIMSPYIIEISNGVDVVDAVAKFSRRRNTGLCVLSASGAVANVTIRQPSPNSASTVTFHGRFDILSLSATFLTPAVQAQLPSAALTVAVSLSIPQGQIIGGIVAGPLTAVGTVYVVAASFTSPSYQRLPLEDEAPRINNTTSSNDQQSPSAASGDNNNNNNSNAGGGESGTLAIYNCNMASDVIWAPTPRQPY